jgi:hypothetical protein
MKGRITFALIVLFAAAVVQHHHPAPAAVPAAPDHTPMVVPASFSSTTVFPSQNFRAIAFWRKIER